MHWLETFPSTCPSLLCCPAFLSVLDGRKGVSKGLIWKMLLSYCRGGNRLSCSNPMPVQTQRDVCGEVYTKHLVQRSRAQGKG